MTQNISLVEAERHCRSVSQSFAASKADWLIRQTWLWLSIFKTLAHWGILCHSAVQSMIYSNPNDSFLVISPFLFKEVASFWSTQKPVPSLFLPPHIKSVIRLRCVYFVNWWGFALLFQHLVTIWLRVSHLYSLSFFITKMGGWPSLLSAHGYCQNEMWSWKRRSSGACTMLPLLAVTASCPC